MAAWLLDVINLSLRDIQWRPRLRHVYSADSMEIEWHYCVVRSTSASKNVPGVENVCCHHAWSAGWEGSGPTQAEHHLQLSHGGKGRGERCSDKVID